MKKLTKILGMFACAFVLMLSGMFLTACGGAYSVKGMTFKGTSECFVVWAEGLTDDEKASILEELDVASEESLIELYSTHMGPVMETFTQRFNEDGTVDISIIEHEGEDPQTISGYWAQSEDLTKVINYHDAEHTDVIGDGAHGLEYVNGKFCLNFVAYSDYQDEIGVYFVFERV